MCVCAARIIREYEHYAQRRIKQKRQTMEWNLEQNDSRALHIVRLIITAILRDTTGDRKSQYNLFAVICFLDADKFAFLFMKNLRFRKKFHLPLVLAYDIAESLSPGPY